MTEPALTVCSVSFNSRHWLNLGLRLTDRLNPDVKVTWVVAENSPTGPDLALRSEDNRFNVIPGAQFQQRPYASGSYHHAAGMNNTLQHISTPFVLFCDPDFFIARSNWITDVLAHMQARQIAVMGVPWHPRWIYKNRYFPCVHCMFVDLD